MKSRLAPGARGISVLLAGAALLQPLAGLDLRLPQEPARQPRAGSATIGGAGIDPANFTAAERTWLGHEGNLRPGAALDVLLADLRRVCALDPPGAAGRRLAAFAEYQVLHAAELSRGFADPARLRGVYAGLADTPLAAAHPALRDAIGLRLMLLHRVGGDDAALAAARRDLGLVTDWWLIGPFDNERGSGYGRQLGPERELDLDKSYPGKKRDVRWRPLPVEPPAGIVDLGALVRPNRQVACLVATALKVGAPVDAVLWLGSSEGFEVFLNGEKVGGRDLQRSFAFDQDPVVLPLQAGANLLALRVLTQTRDPAFAARIRRLDGTPLRGLVVAGTPADLGAAAAQRPRPRLAANREAVPDTGARSVFGAGPADAFRLASVLRFYHADDDEDRRQQDAASRAVQGLPEHPAPRLALALTRLQSHRVLADREDNPRRHDYEAVLVRHPDHPAALLALARMDMESTSALESAERRIRAALRSSPESPELHLALAEILDDLDLPGLAEQVLQRAVTADPAGNLLTRALRRRTGQLTGNDRLAEAEPLLRELCRRESRAGDRIALARTLLSAGRRDAAVVEYRAGIADFPFDSRFAGQLARLLEAEGDAEAAVQPLQAWLAVCPEDDAAMIELARLHGLLHRDDRQRELLRSAVTLNPNRGPDRRRLEFLEADTRPFYADYTTHGAAVIQADRGAPADSAAANDPFYFLLDQRVVHAYRNGTTSTYRHFVVRVLNPEGSKAFARYRVAHYWGEQRARLLEVQVHKADGTVQRPQLRGSATEIPGLAPGDLLEIRQRVDDLAPGFFGEYFGLEHRFGGRQPVNLAELTLVLEKGREYRLQAANGAPEPTRGQDQAGNQVWRFQMRDLGRETAEDHQPDPAETRPLVRVTTYGSWNDFAAWWWNLIRKQSEVSPAIRAKVSELTGNLQTTREKIAAIYRFVTTDVRYEAWEFGVHGYKPYSTPVIFERRHGDCKDKSLLLNAMLSVIGVEAYPVLIRAEPRRSADDLSLPMVGHFNHCISYVEKTADTPAMFLDGTATYHPLDTVPEMDRGAEVLVVRGPQGEVRQVPWPEAAANQDRVSIDVDLAANGDARVRYRYEPTRNRAVWVRELLGNEPARRKEHLERVLKDDFGAITITGFEVGDLQDLSAPVVLTVDFRAPRLAPVQGEGLVLASAITAEPLGQLALAETRTRALLIGVPYSTELRIRYRLPAGFAPLSLPAAKQLRTGFGSFSLQWEQGDGELTVTRRLSLETNRIPPERYREFREFATAVDGAGQQVVVIRKGGGR